MTLEERVELLERQIVHIVTIKQVRDIVNAMDNDLTQLTESNGSLDDKLTIVINQLQLLKETLEDHETRLVALE